MSVAWSGPPGQFIARESQRKARHPGARSFYKSLEHIPRSTSSREYRVGGPYTNFLPLGSLERNKIPISTWKNILGGATPLTGRPYEPLTQRPESRATVRTQFKALSSAICKYFHGNLGILKEINRIETDERNLRGVAG